MDSKLQIISGVHRGRKLFLPPNARPTQNRARAALFNMLQSLDVRPTNVWDAFAGSGAFGIEIMSRYPDAAVTFTDVAPDSVATIKKNLNLIGADAHATVIAADAMSRISNFGANADLIFLDPPYVDANLGAAFVRKLGRVAQSGTVLIWEQDGVAANLPDADAWEILRDKQYGRARFLILRKI